MFRRSSKPKLMPLSIQPVGGEIYAYVTENPRTGLSRNLFWNFYVDLEPIALDGEEWAFAFLADWLTFPVPSWRDLESMSLSRVTMPGMIEASLYLMAEHHPARLTEFRLSDRVGASFELTIEASAEVATDQGKRVVPVSFTTRLQFSGIIVGTDDLHPKPASSASVAATVSQFIQLDSLQDPRAEGWRYVLEPVA